MNLLFSLLVVLSLNVMGTLSVNKYSAEMNQKKDEEPIVNFRTLEKPFRMAKLNMLWSKAQIRLTEPKLKSLYSDLKIQDKEEINHKRFKSEGKDKEGLKEAELRRKLVNLMTAYNLLEHFEEGAVPAKSQEHKSHTSDEHLNKSLFKDKKLNRLWAKAEMAGFTSEEMQALKEEFTHHQEKVEEYYSLLDDVERGRKDDIDNAMDKEEQDRYNDVSYDPENTNTDNDLIQKANMVRKKHEEVKDGYDRLHRLSAQGPLNRDFVEPKVQHLWSIALKSDFTMQELESLRVELKHYEARLLKLRHMQAEHASSIDSMSPKMKEEGIKPEGHAVMVENIKKQMRKVEKIHLDLENRITTKHVEL